MNSRFRGGLPPANHCQEPRRGFCAAVFACLLIALVTVGHTQTPQTVSGVIRLKVRYKSGELTKELPRKRFFLIKGSLQDNRSLIDAIRKTEIMSRDCYYRDTGGSAQLIKWLNENDCESVYCRQVDDTNINGSEAVPEFKAAYDQALRELKTPEVARRWLANYLPGGDARRLLQQQTESNWRLNQAGRSRNRKAGNVDHDRSQRHSVSNRH